MLSVKDSRELQAVVLSLRAANRDVVKTINAQSRSVIVPEWQKGLDARAHTIAEKRLLAGTGRVKVTAQGVQLQAGGLSRKLSGGLSTNDARAVEFGANRNAVGIYRTRSRKGKSYQVARHHQRQLVWKRKAGPVYKTAEDLIPRIASLWVQTVVRTFHEAFEGRQS